MHLYWEAAQISSEGQKNVMSSLVEKAEVVFLWLHLAVRSLIAGLDNGDSEEELVQSLAALPSELSRLYSDMWTRLNGNVGVYRQDTARLLNLIICVRALADDWKTTLIRNWVDSG